MNWEQFQAIRSISSTEKAYVRFINYTDRRVELVWINYCGKYVKHFLEEKGNFIDVNTYKSHPWIALDADTKDRLHIELSFVYYPKTTKEYFMERYPMKEIPLNYEARIRVKITNPLYSLQFRAMLVVRNHLRTPDQADSLDIPVALKENLKKSVELRNVSRWLYAERGI